MSGHESKREDGEQRLEAASGQNGVSPALIGLLIVAVLAAIFFLQNGATTTVELWGFTWDTTIRWSLLVAIGIGVLLDRLLTMVVRRRRKQRDKP
ncbi:MAG: hypothetical protein WD023_00425 [Ilumatobacteraceae bacterium]